MKETRIRIPLESMTPSRPSGWAFIEGDAWVKQHPLYLESQQELMALRELLAGIDPILTKTGKSREWWRYHYVGLSIARGWTIHEAVLGADLALEELEK